MTTNVQHRTPTVGQQQPMPGTSQARRRGPGGGQRTDAAGGGPGNARRAGRSRRPWLDRRPRGREAYRDEGASGSSDRSQHRGDRERVPRDDASRPEYSNPRPAREPRRTIATWTGQVGDQPPRVYASAAPWRDQMRVPSALALESVPRIFKGCTLQDFGAAQPGVVLATDPGAKYCEACGGLVVNLARHEASRLHRDRVKAGTPRKDRSPHRDAAEVRARMARDPEFAALVLGPELLELPEPSAEAVDLEQEEALEVDLLEL
ncbi:hypothetical protein HPB49_012510 [Dermacentor silvarum]|uniref:Uncharacterized protein n=2 Tax=Dermacentor silvarum TaxID=543639 RepID=A0ACB8E035_DERSI|nr:hypothetical protein HPB49_012199 [Dermacentor silvarum]KAH7980005.1 hypothetical protein HPB49_012510 [Dermacentor silvarum]